MQDLRELHSSDSGRLVHNFRPIQPLNGRRILYRPSLFDKKLLCGDSSAVRIIAALLIIIIFYLH
ncbi:hypothetical protein Angca_009439 [Angiostrongylus cantonensis]|nr:hypothetical protein Angca_009439 [Angiostrongylus cantonensis]